MFAPVPFLKMNRAVYMPCVNITYIPLDLTSCNLTDFSQCVAASHLKCMSYLTNSALKKLHFNNPILGFVQSRIT